MSPFNIFLAKSFLPLISSPITSGITPLIEADGFMSPFSNLSAKSPKPMSLNRSTYKAFVLSSKTPGVSADISDSMA